MHEPRIRNLTLSGPENRNDVASRIKFSGTKTRLFATASQKGANISQNSVATHLRGGGIFNDDRPYYKFSAESHG